MDPHQLAWVFVALGLGLLAWAGYDVMMGTTHVEKPFGWPEAVHRDAEPDRFRRTITACLIAAAICLAFGGYLFIAG